ncbi:MAG TPA: monovalent cation/H+ antiporter complex subunit F [Bacteroidales bacterium]|nr:monovalent cation/H+ antiporter complex subunit F [Bacteroidales bacterium]
MTESTNIILYVSLGILVISLFLVFIRMFKGPSIQDRVVALDLTASIAMGFILIYGVMKDNAIYFDIPVIIALISFIGTVAISTYLKRKEKSS